MEHDATDAFETSCNKMSAPMQMGALPKHWMGTTARKCAWPFSKSGDGGRPRYGHGQLPFGLGKR